MAKRQPKPLPEQESIRDEAIYIPKGETTYTVDLDQLTVEELSNGICSEELAERMFLLLKWRRDALRVQARERAPLFQESA